jgi:hypothetical protein
MDLKQMKVGEIKKVTANEALPKLVLDTLEKTLEGVSKDAAHLQRHYLLEKFTRRILSDYIGNEGKLKEIYKKVTNIRDQFDKAIKELEMEVG